MRDAGSKINALRFAIEKNEELNMSPESRNPNTKSRATKFRMLMCILLAGGTVFGQEDVLYQVSTLSALVGGVYDGETTLGQLLPHGDFGIGTFNSVDGEMLLLDGIFRRIGGDGKVSIAALNEKTPFAAVTFFHADESFAAEPGLGQEELFRFIDGRLPSPNLFYAVKIHGSFRSVRTRSVPRQAKPYRPLTEIVKTQPVFEFRDAAGVMAGFRCPVFAAGINFTGYHLHFMADSEAGGGHVLGFVTDRVIVEIDETDEFHMKLPADSAFMRLDLSPDRTADVKRVER
jgi:acetolactate decarboxylase